MNAASDPDPWGLDGLRREIADFNPLSLAAAAAALALVEANANSLWRLSILHTLAAEIKPSDEERTLTDADLGALVNEGPLAAIAGHYEDPLDGPLTEEFAFYGGSHLVGEGLGESTAYAFRHLARGCLRTDAIPTALRNELISCVVAALTVSDAALRAAGLTANIEPPGQSGRVEIPDRERLVKLQKTLAFDRRRLAGLLPRQGLEALEPLIIDAGEVSFSDEQVFEGSAERTPLLRLGDWLVLAGPFEVLAALRHHLALRISNECGAKLATSLFGDSVDHDVVLSLRRMDIDPTIDHKRNTEEGPFTEISARIDVDKILCALVLVDDLEGIEAAHPYTVWDGREAAKQALARLEEVAAEAALAGDRVLGLLISQPAGRQALMALPSAIAENVVPLGFTAADLETIALLESDDPLALWKFASDESALHKQAKVTTTSMLDIYGSYRDQEHSFGEMREFNLITFLPGFAGPCRVDAAVGRDRHGAIYLEGQVREVERTKIEEEQGGRLYYEHEPSGLRLMINVGRSAPALWVAGPTGNVKPSWEAVESLAYWMAELREPLADFLATLADTYPALQIEVDFRPSEYWFKGGEDPGDDDPGEVTIEAPASAKITLGPKIRRLLPSADNVAEREVVELILEALSQLAEAAGMRVLSASDREAALEAAIPLGVKKHMILLPAEANPMIEAAEGRPRLVQEADRSAARYALGDALYKRFGFREEEIPHERRNEVLRGAVDFLFGEASMILNGVGSEGLLKFLVGMNERLIAESEHSRTILPAKLATYPDSAKTLRSEVAQANVAGICCRFLIEYATAAAPQGESELGLAEFDQALANVAEMLDWADLSDAVHGELSEVDLVVRKDGLLRLKESDRYDAGRGRYFDAHIESQRRASEERWRARFEPNGGGESELTDRLDELMIKEAGVPLRRLGETLVAAQLLARDRGEDAMILDRDEAIAELATILEGKMEEIESAVAYLEMGPRDEFMRPPDGTKTDVYPWLFARRWSYNRRPFLRRRTANGEQLIWGRRHVVTAMAILFGQLGSGRYQHLASATGLRRELGKMAKEKGAEFEGEVAEVFRGCGHVVEQGVKRLAGEKLRRGPGEDLGDIDVLAADPEGKVIWAVECKDLSGTLSSSEVVIEMTGHFGQRGTTSVTKHRERVDWLAERLPAVRDLLRLDAGSEPKLRGLIVTGRDAIAPFIDDLPFELVPSHRLEAYLRSEFA